VNRLLQEPKVLEAIQYSHGKVLHTAAKFGRLVILNRLLEIPVILNEIAIRYWGQTCLDAAASAGHLDIVNRLLQFTAVTNTVDDGDNSAFRAAAASGQVLVMERLLEFQAVENNITAKDNAATCAAAKKGHAEIVNKLLTYTAVQQAIAHNANNLLQNAIVGGNIQIVKRILSFPAVQRELADGAGVIHALAFAVHAQHIEVVLYMMKLPIIRNQITANSNTLFLSAVFTAELNDSVYKELLEIDAVWQYELIVGPRQDGELGCESKLYPLALTAEENACKHMFLHGKRVSEGDPILFSRGAPRVSAHLKLQTAFVKPLPASQEEGSDAKLDNDIEPETKKRKIQRDI
jgi:hypothetical protein